MTPQPGSAPPLEPVAPAGPGRGRLLVAVLAIVAVIGVAVLDRPERAPDQASPPLTPAPTQTGGARPSPSIEPPTGTVGNGPISFADWRNHLSGALEHRAWGVRAFVATDPEQPAGEDGRRSAIREVWASFSPAHLVRPIMLDTADRQVLAIGVTTPRSQPVLDVRVWQLRDGSAEYVPARNALLPGHSIEFILLPPPAMARGDAWVPGGYRVDILTGDEIVRVEVVLPGDPPNPPPAPQRNPAPADELLAGILAGVQPGALTVSLPSDAPPLIACLDAEPAPALDGAAAWLDIERGTSILGTCSEPSLTQEPQVIALLLEEGQRLRTATLVRLEPEVVELDVGTILDTPSAPTGAGAERRRLALFRAGDGASWSAGTYRIDAEWQDSDGRHTGSWLLDIYPERAETRPILLEAARRAEAVAGRWGIVGGLLGSPSDQRPGSAPTDTAVLGRTCEGAKILSAERVVTVGYRGDRPAEVRIWRLFANGLAERPALVALDAVPGALILAPVGDTVWRAGYYAIDVRPPPSRAGEVRDVKTLVFCVGAYEPDGNLAVPLGVEDALEFLRDRPDRPN